MNTLLRIVWKDFLGLRGRLALWCGVMLLKSGLGIWLLFGPLTGAGAERIGATMGVLAVLELALTFLLAGLLVQADPLVGEHAFWRTRPISGGRLLAGKMLGAVLLLGLPVVLAALPWWLACAARPLDMAAAAAWLLAIQALVAVPAMLIAALTASASRFLVGSVVMLFVVTTTLSTWLPGAAAGMNLMRPFVLLGGWLVVALAVTAAQYVRVGFRRAVGGLVAGGALVFALAAWAPLRPWDDAAARAERNTARAAGVTLRIATTEVTVPAHKRGPEGFVSTRMHADGLPEGTEAGLYETRHVWTWADGTTSEVRGFPMFRPTGLVNCARRALGLTERGAGGYLVAFAHVDAALRDRIKAGAKSYTVTARVAVLRPRLLGELPARSGGGGAWAGRGIRLLDFGSGEAPKTVFTPLAVTTEFPTSPGGLLTLMRRSKAGYSSLHLPRYFLRSEDRQRAELLAMRDGPEFPFAGVLVALRMSSDTQGRPSDWSEAGTVAMLEWDEEAAVMLTATHAP